MMLAANGTSALVLEQKPCPERILEMVADGPIERKALRERLKSERYSARQISRALRQMADDGRLILHWRYRASEQMVEKPLVRIDKRNFFKNLDLPVGKSLSEFTTIRLEAIKTEADKSYKMGYTDRAFELFRWFVTEYNDCQRMYKNFGDHGFDDVKNKIVTILML